MAFNHQGCIYNGTNSFQPAVCMCSSGEALLATTQGAAEAAINTYQSVTNSFGLPVSLPKTKFMVAGFGIRQEPIEVEGGVIVSNTLAH